MGRRRSRVRAALVGGWIVAALVWPALTGCSAEPAQAPGGQVPPSGCKPGTMMLCPCPDDSSGVKVCQENGSWAGCDCSGEILIDSDLLVTGETGEPPLQTGGGGLVSEAAGAAFNLKSENYTLRLIVGSTRPAGAISSESYRLKLGPGLGEIE